MTTINVKLNDSLYEIIIGNKILPRLGSYIKKLNIGKDAIIITNPIIRKLYGQTIALSLQKNGFSVKTFEAPEGERSKSARIFLKLIERIATYDVMRIPFIIALGGGVIGDLAGYIAASYKRGIPYIHIPTTFLAQIDSSIGGKVAIDLAVGKNLIGAFYQPRLVFTDVSALSTLDKRQIRNGVAEAIKYGIIADKILFNLIDNNFDKIINLNPKILTEIVRRCSAIKADIVSKDEKETKGIRTILNFGHTIGHAIETACKYNYYQHGEVVALGMRVSLEISKSLGMLSEKDANKINEVITTFGLPRFIKRISLGDIISAMRHDKKFIAGENRFVLASQIGKVKVVEGISSSIIRQAIKSILI